jgi:hypothetical protein
VFVDLAAHQAELDHAHADAVAWLPIPRLDGLWNRP